MSSNHEPNPPSRRQESFPKTTTIPEGWNGDALMASYNPNMIPDGAEDEVQAATRPAPDVDEELFSRRLDPFPKPNTIPNGWDLSEIYS
jgi:hypothetical protein